MYEKFVRKVCTKSLNNKKLPCTKFSYKKFVRKPSYEKFVRKLCTLKIYVQNFRTKSWYENFVQKFRMKTFYVKNLCTKFPYKILYEVFAQTSHVRFVHSSHEQKFFYGQY